MLDEDRNTYLEAGAADLGAAVEDELAEACQQWEPEVYVHIVLRVRREPRGRCRDGGGGGSLLRAPLQKPHSRPEATKVSTETRRAENSTYTPSRSSDMCDRRR